MSKDLNLALIDEQVDEVLRKICVQGQDSLTKDERGILKQASRKYRDRK